MSWWRERKTQRIRKTASRCSALWNAASLSQYFRMISCNLCSELVSLNHSIWDLYWSHSLNQRVAFCTTQTRLWGRHFLNLPKEIFHMMTVSCEMGAAEKTPLLAMQQLIALTCLYCDIWDCEFLFCNKIFSVFIREWKCYFHQGWCIFGCHNNYPSERPFE